MANKTTIPNKNIGDFLSANEFNELNNAYNNSVDSIESQIISELHLYDSTLTFSGFANTSTSTPAHSSGNAYKVTEAGTIFGISAEKGQWIIDDGNSFTSYDNDFNSSSAVSAINSDADHGSTADHDYYTDSDVDSHLSGGTGIDYSSGDISIDSTVATETWVGNNYNNYTFSEDYDDLSNKPSIAYSSPIAADDFTQGEVDNLRAAKLDDGSTPWTSNNNYTDSDVNSHLSGGTGIDYTDGSISIDSTVATETWVENNYNNYSHPSHPGDDIDVDTTALSGATVIDDIDINVTTDSEGHVTDANGSISTRDLNHNDINSISSDDHHTKYTDGEARSAAVNNSISDGNTTTAPSEDAVYDALANKSDTGHNHDSAYLNESNNLSDLDNNATARSNLNVDIAGTVNYSHPDYTEDDVDTSDLQIIDTITVVNGHVNGHTTREIPTATPNNGDTTHLSTAKQIYDWVDGNYNNYTDEMAQDAVGNNLGGTLAYNDTSGAISLSHLGLESLSDPGADRIAFWDNSADNLEWLSLGTGLNISGTSIEMDSTKIFEGSVDFDTIDLDVDFNDCPISFDFNNHPSYNGDDAAVDTGVLSGATVVSDLDFNITTNGSGHVTDANATYDTRNLTLADLGFTGDTDANNYSHPSYNGDDFSVDSGALSGATVIDDIDINVTTDSGGHVTDTNGSIATRELTPGDIGAEPVLTFGISNDNAVEIDDADVVSGDYAKFTANGLQGRSYSEILSDLSGQAGNAFDFNGQDISNVGDLDINGGQTVNITTVNSATYDLLESDYILNVTYTTTAELTSLTLPTAQCISGRRICIKDAGGNAGTNSITVDTESDETIDGDNTYTLNINYEYIWLYSNGSNWFIN